MLEYELFAPVKDYFINLGYTVDGEVLNVDMVCIKDSSTIAIELKTSLNFKVFEQAALRQRQIDLVYICIPRPKDLYKKSFKNKLYLLKRLGIGLILVTSKDEVIIYSDPIVVFTKQKKLNKNKDIIREISNRRLKNNVGGTNKQKNMTSYKEESLIILSILKESSPIKGGKVKSISNIKNATKIMYDNYSKWFTRQGSGFYSISEKGNEAYYKYESEIKELLNK